MAVRFNADADRLRRNTGLPAWSSYTFCCFAQLVSNVGSYSAIFSLEENGGSFHVLETDADGSTLKCFIGFAPSADITLGSMMVGTSYFIALAHDGTTVYGYFGEAGAATPLTASSTAENGVRTFVDLYIGGDGFNEPGDLRVSGVRLWDTKLAPEELENERRSVQPYRLADLNSFYPMLSADEKLVDFSGQGRDLTTPGAGTWETEENPPVPWKRPRGRLFLPPSTSVVVLNAEPGEVNITGTDAFLLQQARVVADPGAVVIAGTDAVLRAEHTLGAEPGAVVIAGQAATLVAESNLQADPGAVAVAGTDAELVATDRLVADPGAVIITGTDATFTTQSAGSPLANLTLVPAPRAQVLVQPSPRAILALK